MSEALGFIRKEAAKPLSIATLSILAITGCSGDGKNGAPASTPVHAKIENPHAGGVGTVLTYHHEQTALLNGTHVDALCVDGGPFTLRVLVKDGIYKGRTATRIPRADLVNTNDPYEAGTQKPAEDPFGALDPCTQRAS